MLLLIILLHFIKDSIEHLERYLLSFLDLKRKTLNVLIISERVANLNILNSNYLFNINYAPESFSNLCKHSNKYGEILSNDEMNKIIKFLATVQERFPNRFKHISVENWLSFFNECLNQLKL